MESKSARRRNRQSNVACEEGSIGQQAFDKILRLEGRFGTLHEKFIESIAEVQELRSRIDMLEKLFLFIDVDKLNDAIKKVVEEDCLVKAYETDSSLTKQIEQPSTPTMQLKLHELLGVTPGKSCCTKILDSAAEDTTKILAFEKLHDTSSMVSTDDDAEASQDTTTILAFEELDDTTDDDAGASLTNEDFDALQDKIDELSGVESERFFHEVCRLVAPCELSGDLVLDITASNYQQLLQITNDAKEPKWIQCG